MVTTLFKEKWCNKNLMMTLIIHLLHSRDVVVVISQLLFIAHAVVPVPQFLIPSATDIHMARFHFDRKCKNNARSIVIHTRFFNKEYRF